MSSLLLPLLFAASGVRSTEIKLAKNPIMDNPSDMFVLIVAGSRGVICLLCLGLRRRRMLVVA